MDKKLETDIAIAQAKIFAAEQAAKDLAALALKTFAEQAHYFNKDRSSYQLRKCKALEARLKTAAEEVLKDEPKAAWEKAPELFR